MPGGRRSPVDHALRELAGVYREIGTSRGVSLDEAIDVAKRVSRRQFLRLGGATAGGLVLAGCTGSTPAEPVPGTDRTDPDGPPVAIVGAGLAGMTVAYRLQQAGVATQVFEARDRVGGRCWSARDFAGGQVGEHGGEFIDTRHVHISMLAAELGLDLDDLWSAWEPDSTWLEYVDGEVVEARDVLAPLQPAIRELVQFARSNGRGIAPGASPKMREFDQQTMADWYEQAVGPTASPAFQLWSSRQAGWYGLEPSDLGAGNVIGFYAIGYPGDDERYTIHGGNDQVPARILEELSAGTVQTETPLVAIRQGSSGRFELVFEGAKSATADRVVLTLPFTALREVDLSGSGLPPRKLTQIEQLGMGTNAKVLLQFDRSFPMGDWSGGMQRGDAPAFGTWESGGTDPGADQFGLLTVFSGGRVGAGYRAETPHGPASQSVVDKTLQAVDAVVPGTSDSFNGRAWLDSWVQDPWAHGSYAGFLPTQTTRMFGTIGRPEGAVHFAGEHTSTYSQGYLNGGVESGSRVAAEVLEALGKELPDGLAKSLKAQQDYLPRYPWS